MLSPPFELVRVLAAYIVFLTTSITFTPREHET